MANSYAIFEWFCCVSVRRNAKRKPYGLDLNRQAIFTANPIQNSKVMITLKHNSSSIWFFSATKDLSWTDLGASLDGFSFLKKRKKYADLLKKRNFACPQKPTILKEILEYLNWVIFNHACKYHFKLTIFSKISIKNST